MLRKIKLILFILQIVILVACAYEKALEYTPVMDYCPEGVSTANDYDTLKVIRIPIGNMIHLAKMDETHSDQREKINTKVEDRKEKELMNNLYAKGAVLMDAESGRVLFGKNEEESLAMASTTKIMTCILALECMTPDDVVTFSTYAVSMPKVKMYGKRDEQFYMQDLLKAMMLESYNDAAVAIAEAVGKKYLVKENAADHDYVEYFVSMMNQKAMELGCENTHFLTPNGLDAPGYSISQEEMEKGHVTTASDLAKIMRYCICISEKREEFVSITQVRNMNFFSLQNRHFSATNRNQLLNQLSGAESGKTGYTSKAGYCYVGSMQQGGKHLIVSLLACGWPSNRNYKWLDSKKLFQYGMENYFDVNLSDLEIEKIILPCVDVIVKNTDNMQVGMVTRNMEKAGGEEVLLNEKDELEIYCYYCRNIKNSVLKGENIGRAVAFLDDMEVGRYDLISMTDYQIKEDEYSKAKMAEYILLTC